MDSGFFLIISVSSAILGILSVMLEKRDTTNRDTKRDTTSRDTMRDTTSRNTMKFTVDCMKTIWLKTNFNLFILPIVFTIIVALVLLSILPNIEHADEKIFELEEQVNELENTISFLEKENQVLQNQILKYEDPIFKYGDNFITFDTSDSGYCGSITPFFILYEEKKTVSIMLSPAEGYYIECVDSNNNLIETTLKNKGTWLFAMPDSNVTVFIKHEAN